MGKPHIEVKNVVHEYEGRAVVSVESLSIERGKTLALIGPNGSGKSTFLRLVGLLERATSGRILMDGVDPWESNRALDFRRRTAAVFQEPLLFAGSVFDNVAYGLRLRRLPKDEIVDRAERAMRAVGISHLKGRASARLSGGEAQRTSLARALALEPEMLLLDEPFASLDPPTREALLDDFESIIKGSAVTALYVTHHRTEALLLGDKVAVMVGGSLDQVGTTSEVFARPETFTVADIVGCDNRLSGRVLESEGGLVVIGVGGGRGRSEGAGTIEALSDAVVGTAVTACIRPEEITILREGGEAGGSEARSSARNHFKGRVGRIADLGALSRLTVEGCVDLVALVTKKSIDELELRVGAEVTATFKATGVHVIKASEVDSR